MFDLEQAITKWRQRMLASGIQSPVPLEELEGHLREEIEQRMKAGLSEREAFGLAASAMGRATLVSAEFEKETADIEDWNHRLLWTALGTFAISFCLPACGQLWGWQCAVLAACSFWPGEFPNLNWVSIHLMLVTVANLFILTSPFWLARFARRPQSRPMLVCATVAALGVVWSFLAICFIENNGPSGDLKAGSYLWAVSFWLLAWCIIPKRKSRMQYV